MNPTEIIDLITFLDVLFSLGGKLIEAAIQKEPILSLTPLPILKDLDLARSEAEARLNLET